MVIVAVIEFVDRWISDKSKKSSFTASRIPPLVCAAPSQPGTLQEFAIVEVHARWWKLPDMMTPYFSEVLHSE
jgi:hypothetical protein